MMNIVIATPPGRFPGNRYPCPFPSRWTSIFHNYPVFIFFPYELAYLSSLLKREIPNARVKMVDGTWLRFTVEDYIRWLEWQKPDWLIFETDTVTYNETLKVARAIKQKCGTRIIMTGQYPTVFPHRVLEDGMDYACIGEYEATVFDILKGDAPSGIPGLFPNSYRKVLDIDWLPDPEDEDIRRIDYSYPGGCRWTKYRSIELHASRGCPYSCDFCVAGTVYYEKNNWRFRKPERIIGEIDALRRKYPSIEGVFFDEETHIVKKKTILEFCDAIIASGNNDLHFEAMANHQLLDEEIMEAIARAGYYKLRIGIETVDEETGNSIGRKTRADKLASVLRVAKKLGIEMYGTFILGASGSTQKGDLTTIEYGGKLLEEGLLSSWQTSIAVPHPGTPFYEKARKNGWLDAEDPEMYNGIHGSVLNYPNYPKEQIKETVGMMWQRFSKAVETQAPCFTRSLAAEKTFVASAKRDGLRTRITTLNALFNAGNNESALREAREIVRLYPQALRPRHVIACLHERQGDFETARTGFEEIVSLAQDYDDAIQHAASAHFHLGWMDYQAGDRESAMCHFRECMHLNPDHKLARKYFWVLENPRAAMELEAGFWGKFEEDFSGNGNVAAPWIDVQNARKVEGLYDFWADPAVERVLRGREKRTLLEILNKPEIHSVLEIGCGSGWLSLELARLGKKVTGVELSPGRLAIAKKIAAKHRLEIEYVQGDAVAFCELGRRFDAVVAWDSLHHIADLSRLMRALKNLLPPGGTFAAFDHVGGAGKENMELANALLGTSRLSPLKADGTNGNGPKVDEELSPYEDVGSFMLEETIRKHFTVMRRSTHIAFTGMVAAKAVFVGENIALLEELKGAEERLIQGGIIRGEYLFIEAINGKK